MALHYERNVAVIDNGAFDDLVKLRWLHTFEIEMQNIPAGLFEKMKKLREVTITNYEQLIIYRRVISWMLTIFEIFGFI